MDYYSMISLIENLHILIHAKERELLQIQNNDESIDKKVQINNLVYEIDEMRKSIVYYDNVITDMSFKYKK